MTKLEHGNPTIHLPPGHAGGRVTLQAGNSRAVIWRSHAVPAGTDTIRVDVWDGRFVEKAEGWALLPAGDYVAHWELKPLAQFQIQNRRVFEESRIGVPPVPSDQTNGRQAGHLSDFAGETAYWFREGAMHGELVATFRRTDPCQPAKCWGLIARHYNAFHHLQVVCRQEHRGWSLRLVRVANEPSVIAETAIQGSVPAQHRVTWAFNGTRHTVSVDGIERLTGCEGYMGGVEIVGIFADADSVTCSRVWMDSTQWVPRHEIAWPEYSARIRPGNIGWLSFVKSGAPGQNVCWESGIQFGHIGGSEIKFTLGAALRVTDAGPVATTVTWHGPMPKFVEQSRDVRGFARGRATFYPDQIVVADEVLAWVRRSVGPDIDLLGRLLAGPARVVLGNEREFRQWHLPADGGTAVLEPLHDATFPAALAFPLRLGTPLWWLKALVLLRYPQSNLLSTRVFAWQCPRGLTASHDFRVSPTTPGQEYAFTIVLCWQSSADAASVEQDLLNLRDDWTSPMLIEPLHGSVLHYNPRSENPREALDFDGCFDRATGRYVVVADKDRVGLRLDPLQVPRRAVTLGIRNWPHGHGVECRLDGSPLRMDEDFLLQESGGGEAWLRLRRRIDRPVRLEILREFR